ncbi:MAG: InlB B-repeat-containing protein [Bacteroidales bacterium]
MKKHFQLLALIALVISAIGFNSCRKEKNDDDANGGDTATSYTVTFDANGGDKAPKAETVEFEKAITLPAQGEMTPPEGKFTFLGWNTDKDASAAKFKVGEAYTPTEDITLYAIWDISLVKKVEGYMALSVEQFKEQMKNEGFAPKENAQENQYEKSIDGAVVGCTISYNPSNLSAISGVYYYEYSTSSNSAKYIEQFEDWRTQIYALYTGEFNGKIIMKTGETLPYGKEDQEKYKTDFAAKKNNLRETSISIASKPYTVESWASFASYGDEVFLWFYPSPTK